VKRTCLLVGALAVLTAFPAPAHGLVALPAECVLDVVIFTTPGLSSTTPGLSEGRVGDGRGTVDCRGLVDGQQVTGPGTYANVFRFGPGPAGDFSCAQGGGTGAQTFTIPTTAGPVTRAEQFSFTWVGPTGRFGGASLSGTFEFIPLTGDCVTSPVSRAAVRGQGVLADLA
jgi:hypothetical protein